MNLEEFLTFTLEECPVEERSATGLLLAATAVYSVITDEKEDVLQFSMPKMNYSKDILDDLDIRIAEQDDNFLITAPRNLFQVSKKAFVKVAVKK